MIDNCTPKSITKLRTLDRMKTRARPAWTTDVLGSRHREYVEAMAAARAAYVEQNASLRMMANILEELLVLQQRA